MDLAAAVDLAAVGPEKCIKRYAQTAKRNAKFLLNPEKTVRSTARNASLSIKTAAVKNTVFCLTVLSCCGLWFAKDAK